MPRFEDGCYGSLKGVALIAKVLAGRCRMHYTRVAVGKGVLPEDLTPKTLTEPPEYVMDAMISAVTNPIDGECQVSVQINSANVENGFYCTWLILYAEDPDDGEVPFTALCLENEPEWIRPSSSIVGKLAHFDMIAAVGDVDNVSATIDPDAIATYAAVKQLIAEAIAVLEITIPKEGWTDGAGRIEEGCEDTEDLDSEDNYGLHVDIPVDGMTETMQPQLSVHLEHLKTAMDCELSTVAQTMDGVLRLYAKSVPAANMTATLTLLCATSGAAGGGWGPGTGRPLPAATGTTLGGVMVREGSGLTIDSSGNLTLDTAAPQDVEQLFAGSNG
ncbi:MAG: hypothetical protein HFF18_04260 [Oscillospiraceae bacterium]|nr:hypothetical protein [Oscillospiraceae bacterium]